MAGGQETHHTESIAEGSKESDEDSEDSIKIDAEQPSNKSKLKIVENATLDVDQVADQYTGVTRLQRLVFIARHCPALRMEALKLAEKCVLSTRKVALATTICHMKLVAGAEEKPEPDPSGETPLNQEWIERTRKEARKKLMVLKKQHAELMSRKDTDVTKDIRKVLVQLAHLYLDLGDLQKAGTNLHSAWYYCATFATLIQVVLNSIRVYVHMKSWDNVRACLMKAEGMMDSVKETECSAEEKEQMLSEINCARGLMLLADCDYRTAAQTFLLISFDFCDLPQLLSTSGVTVCTVLCALTTFAREELQNRLLFNSKFNIFLELEPEWREVLEQFTRGMYSWSLRKLQGMRDNLLLDMHLHPHVHTLLFFIRERALCQYMDPYLSADMNKMALEFNSPVEALEEELVDLISSDQISARIDSHNKVLYFKKVDQRSIAFEQVLTTGKDYLRSAQALLLRAAVLKNDIIVKARRSRSMSDTPSDPNLFPNYLNPEFADNYHDQQRLQYTT